MKVTRKQLHHLIESLLKEQVLVNRELKSNLKSPAKVMSIVQGDNAHITNMLEALSELHIKVQNIMCSNQDLMINNIDMTIKGMKASIYQIADEKAKKGIDELENAFGEMQLKVNSICAVGPVKSESTLSQDILDVLESIAISMDNSVNSPKSNERVEIHDRTLLVIINELSKDDYLYAIEDAIKYFDEYIDVTSQAAEMFKRGEVPLPKKPTKPLSQEERRAARDIQKQKNLEKLINVFNGFRNIPRGIQKVVNLIRKMEQLIEEVEMDNVNSQEKVKVITSEFEQIYIVLDFVDTLADMAYDFLHPIDYFKSAYGNLKKLQYDDPADYIEY